MVDIDGVRYPTDGVSIDYASNDYNDQYRNSKLFYKEYLGKQLLTSFTSYTDLKKNKYPIHVIELRFQVDHINPKKVQLFEEHRQATNNARLFVTLVKHRKIKTITDGIKITKVTII